MRAKFWPAPDLSLSLTCVAELNLSALAPLIFLAIFGPMTKTDLPILKGARITLRPPCDEDATARFSLGNDPEIVRMYGGSRDDAHAMSMEEATRVG